MTDDNDHLNHLIYFVLMVNFHTKTKTPPLSAMESYYLK